MKIAFIHPHLLAYDRLSPDAEVTGVPGAEETLIQFSRQLYLQGAEVTIYTVTGLPDYISSGVAWKDLQTMNQCSSYDVMVSWSDSYSKMQKYIDSLPQARVRAIRLVNQQSESELIRLFQYFPFVFSQSRWLAKRFSFLNSQNSLLLTNGINPESLRKNESPKVNNRFIYASDYDRGLYYLLQLWPRIRDVANNATLHICYGWEIFDKKLDAYDQETKHQMLRVKESIISSMQQDGIVNLGRVGHDQVASELAQAEYWAYPCVFPENCSTLSLKAVAQKCMPLIIRSGGLIETVRYGAFPSLHLYSDTIKDSQERVTAALNDWAVQCLDTVRSGYEHHKLALEAESRRHMLSYSYQMIASQFITHFLDKIN